MTDTTRESVVVPEGARLLHIGPPKTGSTALQAAMHVQRERMREHGVLHVASDQRGREAVLAALMNEPFTEESDPRLFRRWESLLEEVGSAGNLRVCLSNESMARVDTPKVNHMVDALGGERAHIVAVVRKLDRLLPSQWQEWVRLGSTSLPYDEWLKVVLSGQREDPNWQSFWLPHHLEVMVDRWVNATAAPERFTFVIADESDPQMLSRAFEQLLGLPAGLLKPEETHRKNVSASLDRVEAVRQLNRALEDRDWPAEVKDALRSRVAKRIRSTPDWPGERPIPPLPKWAASLVNELNEQRAQFVRDLGFQVIGDPSNLTTPVPESGPAVGVPDMVSTELAVHSVVTAIGGAVEILEQQRADAERTIKRLRRRARQDSEGSAAASVEDGRRPSFIKNVQERLERRSRRRH